MEQRSWNISGGKNQTDFLKCSISAVSSCVRQFHLRKVRNIFHPVLSSSVLLSVQCEEKRTAGDETRQWILILNYSETFSMENIKRELFLGSSAPLYSAILHAVYYWQIKHVTSSLADHPCQHFSHPCLSSCLMMLVRPEAKVHSCPWHHWPLELCWGSAQMAPTGHGTAEPGRKIRL